MLNAFFIYDRVVGWKVRVGLRFFFLMRHVVRGFEPALVNEDAYKIYYDDVERAELLWMPAWDERCGARLTITLA
jgi:hypothetical protein